MPSRVRRRRNEPATTQRQRPSLSGFGQPPPEGLVPIGESGFYITPDEPADPRDCDRYPDSLWCGGQPFTRLPVELGVDYTLNEEGFSLSILPAFAFIKLPPFSIAYRFPGYRDLVEQEPMFQPDTSNLKKPPPTDWSRLPESGIGYVVLNKHNYSYRYSSGPYDSDPYGRVSTQTTSGHYELSSVTFPGVLTDTRPIGSRKSLIDVYYVERLTSARTDNRTTPTSDSSYQVFNRVGTLSEFDTDDAGTAYSNVTFKFNDQAFQSYIVVAYGTFASIRQRFTTGFYSFQSDSDGAFNYSFSAYELLWSDQLKTNNAPPLPLPEKCDCMSCCSDINALKEMLRKILRQQGEFPKTIEVFDQDETKEGIQKTERTISNLIDGVSLLAELSNRISKIIGIDLLPFDLPESVVETVDDSILGQIWDFITPDATTRIDSLMRAFKWQVLNDSAVLGSWQRAIEEVGDIPRNSDGTPQKDEEGNPKPAPKQKMVLPDIATTLEEIVRLDIRTQKTLGMMFDFIIKLQLEAAGIKTVSGQSLKVIQDIQEYLDYPTTEKVTGVPTQITVPSSNASQEEKNDLHKFEQPSKAYVRYEDWTGEFSLQVQLNQLLTMVRYIKAQQAGGE